MPIIEPCIRPPGEAGSILLQVTTGCSCNSCSFCGAYKDKPFSVKSTEEIFADIDDYARFEPQASKLFLMDGDALVLNNHRLLPILARIKEKLPAVTRISSYANGFNITSRSPAGLLELYNHNLRLVYIGLESGSQEILDFCNKKATVDEMVCAVNLAREAGIQTSLMVLIGLGGASRSEQHIIETARAINAMQPRYLNFLSVMLIPGTQLYKEAELGSFRPLNEQGYLRETCEILRRLELTRTAFYANHASNFLPLSGRLPQKKGELLKILELAMDGKIALLPERFRGL